MRVGGGLALSEEDAVEGVTPSAFAAVMGAFLWMGIGGIVRYVVDCTGLLLDPLM